MGFGIKSIFKGAKDLFDDTLDLTLSPFSAVGDLINPKKPKYPNIPEPTVMPIKDDMEQKRARRRAIAANQARSGRASTILTNQSETMG